MQSLFHYTTAAGLLGIVGQSKLWASDARFLNDAQDSTFAREALFEALRAMPNPVRQERHWWHGTDDEDVFAAEWVSYRDAVVHWLADSSLALGVYVSCFCESGDLLSQWRGYSTDHGYSIEFDASALTAAAGPSLRSSLSPVRYGTELAADVLTEAESLLAGTNLAHPGMRAYFTAVALSALLAKIKHPSFQEEREWRLITVEETFDDRGRTDGRAVHFRSNAVSIIPYLELPFALDAVRSVRVGPGNNTDVRAAGVERLLKSVGSQASVVTSAVPLRV
jgi:Protein of unknown function (DUF2971)